MTINDERGRFREGLAPRLGRQISPWLRPFRASSVLSRKFVFLDDGDALVVLAGGQENQNDVDRALAFGLAWQGDHDLILVLPQGKELPSLHRLAFLKPGRRIFTHDGVGVVEQIIPARDQVSAAYSDPLQLAERELGDRGLWVQDLIAFAEEHPELRAAHRPTYMSWHCLGRLVIKIEIISKGLRLSAGVHASIVSDKYTPLVTQEIFGPLDAAALEALTMAASTTISERLSGNDGDHLEHLLQSRLGDRPELLGLLPNEPGMPRRFFRELPCVRPGARRSYIDLAGVDSRDAFHVVETKIGGDEMLILQGLDYYIWATAHRQALATHLGIPKLDIALDFVVAAKPDGSPAVGPYTAPQADALDGSIPWRFHTVMGGMHGVPTLHTERNRTVPAPRAKMSQIAAQPITGARYSERLQRHLLASSGALRTDGVSVISVDTLIHPAARHVWEELKARGLLHRWSAHVRSSQAFAINLFGPLDAAGVSRLLEEFFGPMATAQLPEFEFEDQLDRLNESTSRRPHRTQVDVVLRGVSLQGLAVALLFEVKLTEDDFGHCSAYPNPANDRRDICTQPGPFGGDPEHCFQLRNHGNGTRRRYDEFLADLPVDGAGCGCSFRLSASQPMRNLAVAGVLASDGTDVKFALCAPREHHAIWRRWDDSSTALDGSRMVDLPAETLMRFHNAEIAKWLGERYQLDTFENELASNAEWATWAILHGLSSRYRHQFQVIETHPGGGTYDCISLCDTHSVTTIFDMNRGGHMHLFRHDADDDTQPNDGWKWCARRGPAYAADRIAHCLKLEQRKHPAPTPWQAMAAVVKDHLRRGEQVHWLNGMLDSSGGDGGVRQNLYDGAGVRVGETSDRSSILDHPAYQDWFCVNASEAVIGHVAAPAALNAVTPS